MMKNKKYLWMMIFAVLLIGSAAFAQPNSRPRLDLKINVKIIENNLSNEGKTKLIVSLTNQGEKVLGATGWSIYFNSNLPFESSKDNSFNIQHLNGDYFKLSANAYFKDLQPGGSVESAFSSSYKNISDYPKGFYIVYENDPEQGIPIQVNIENGIDYELEEKILAGKIYHQNEGIMDISVDKLPPVFPTPVFYKIGEGKFDLNVRTTIITDPLFVNEANYLSVEATAFLGKKIAIGNSGRNNVIRLVKSPQQNPEGYELKVTATEIIISSATTSGMFYGIQSLRTLLPANALLNNTSNFSIPCLIISDFPRFKHRAFMMDVARNFQLKSRVKKVIDLLSLYKINVLHLHLNDDEGWRLEIPGLPELTEIGGKRGHTTDEMNSLLPSYGSGPNSSNPFGSGFFSRNDFIEILKYATARHVTVIPEVETPGHARAAIKAMRARYTRLMRAGLKSEAEKYLLHDIDDKSVYLSAQNWKDNVVNVALPSVYTFLEKVTDEIIAMYSEANAPLNTIHFGGDEVPAGVWEKSPLVAKFLAQDSTIKNTDSLWTYYFSRLNQMMKTKKLYITGWEEIGQHKVLQNGQKKMIVDGRFAGENFHTEVWNNLAGNEDLAYQLANAGYKVILTNVTHFYLDLASNSSFYESGQKWGGYNDLRQLFSFIPFDYYKNQKTNESGEPVAVGYFESKTGLTTKGIANIVGLQAPLWSELITGEELFDYPLLPKLLGLAERAWAADPLWATTSNPVRSDSLFNAAWSVFVNKIAKTELTRLNYLSGGFKYRIPTPGFVSEGNVVKANLQFPGFTLRFTTDGTEPDSNSNVLLKEVSPGKIIKIRAFDSLGRGGRSVVLRMK